MTVITIDNELIEKMKALHNSGLSYGKISKKIGIAKSTVSKYLGGGYKKGYTERDKNALIRAYENGESISDAADRLGMSRSGAEYVIENYIHAAKKRERPYVEPREIKYIVNMMKNGGLYGRDFKFDHYPNYDDLMIVCREMGVKATDFINVDDYRAPEIVVAIIDSRKKMLIQRVCDEEPTLSDLFK